MPDEKDDDGPIGRHVDKDRAPAEPIGEDAADDRVGDRDTAEPGHDVAHDLSRTLRPVYVADHRTGDRRSGARADPLQDPGGHQGLERTGEHGQNRAEREQAHRPQQHGPSAEAVGQRSIHQLDRREGIDEGAHRELRGAGANFELRTNVGYPGKQGIDRRRVQRQQHGEGGAEKHWVQFHAQRWNSEGRAFGTLLSDDGWRDVAVSPLGRTVSSGRFGPRRAGRQSRLESVGAVFPGATIAA